MTDDKTIKTLETIKDKIADYEIKVIKAYRGDNNIDILFNTIYDIIDTQADIIRGSSSERKPGADEPNKSVKYSIERSRRVAPVQLSAHHKSETEQTELIKGCKEVIKSKKLCSLCENYNICYSKEEPQGSRTGERRTNKSVVSSDNGRTARTVRRSSEPNGSGRTKTDKQTRGRQTNRPK